jgi:ribosomal protein S7
MLSKTINRQMLNGKRVKTQEIVFCE